MKKIRNQCRADYQEGVNSQPWEPGAYVTELGNVIHAPQGEYGPVALTTTRIITLLILNSRGWEAL